MGGEKIVAVPEKESLEGSPPRRRGKETVQAIFEGDKGITPAWAGKRRSQGAAALQSGDHPRVGGEKCSSANFASMLEGSPPRGRGKSSDLVGVVPGGRITPRRRGKAELSAAIDHVLGITPAYAGKSRPRRFWAHRSQDHPRVGGEKRSAHSF